MKIGNYTLGPDTIFFSTEEGEPVTMNAGGDIPMTAVWRDGKPKTYGGFLLPSDQEFFRASILSQAAE